MGSDRFSNQYLLGETLPSIVFQLFLSVCRLLCLSLTLSHMHTHQHTPDSRSARGPNYQSGEIVVFFPVSCNLCWLLIVNPKWLDAALSDCRAHLWIFSMMIMVQVFFHQSKDFSFLLSPKAIIPLTVRNTDVYMHKYIARAYTVRAGHEAAELSMFTAWSLIVADGLVLLVSSC